MSLRPSLRSLVALLFVTAVACGGGGGGGDTVNDPGGATGGSTTGGSNTGGSNTGGSNTGGGTNQAGGGIGGTGISFGPITAFGSIFVNGREINLSDTTTVVVNGVSVQGQAGLALGDMVRVVFNTDDTGADTAVEIVADGEVIGAIEAVDPVAGTLTVLGQSIVVDGLTVAQESSVRGGTNLILADLLPGNLVEVCGQPDGNGTVHATRVERRADSAAGATLKIKGIVAGIDTGAETFSIGSLTVSYGNASVDGTLENGVFVEAMGTQPAAGQLAAAMVEVQDLNPTAGGQEGLEVEIEGYVSHFVSLTDFEINGVPITTTTATVFSAGMETQLRQDVKAEVEGHLDGAGTLVADVVSFRASVDIEATAEAVDAGAGTVTVLGGLTVAIDAFTELHDQSSAQLETLTLDQIHPDDWLVITGVPQADGTLLARRLERDNPDPGADVEFRGPVTSADMGTMVVDILGVRIETNMSKFLNRAEQPISATDFYAAAQPGAVVKAKGSLVGSTIVAKEAQIDD